MTTAPASQDEPSQQVEKLLESANSASQTVAALHVAFMAFTAYLGVIVWGTSHEDLLRISPVKLPILDVELPLTAFYCFVPWMVVLLHFNLLMQLELLSCKLWNLDRHIPATPAGQQVRERLFIFPFTHFIAGQSSVRLIRWLLSLVVGITVIALPLFMLLAAQIRFLPFHDESITWSQRIAVWVDAGMLLALWPLIASPKDKAMEWWGNLVFWLLGYWPAGCRYMAVTGWNLIIRRLKGHWSSFPYHELTRHPMPHPGTEPKGMIVILTSVPLVVLLSLFAVVPGSITLQSYYDPAPAPTQNTASEKKPYHFEDWLIRHVPESWLSVAVHQYDTVTCTSLDKANKSEANLLQVMLGPCAWAELFFSRNLILREARLVPKEVSLSLLTRAIDPDKTTRDAAFKEFDGLSLQNRDLRYANLYGAVLPKADLRHVRLQGAILLNAKLQGVVGWDKTQLQGAILGGTQLQGAMLFEANLQGADLRGANLQGTNLAWTKLQGADLRGADLNGANLNGAKLQGADIRGASLQGGLLDSADLQGADISYAKLQGANLASAKLQAAKLLDSQLQGVEWAKSHLDGVYISNSNKQAWDTAEQIKLETLLKTLLDNEKFNAFQLRVRHGGKPKSPVKSASKTGCYSTSPDLLKCDYQTILQLEQYRTTVLHPNLVKLACSDAATALGIAKRDNGRLSGSDADFGLAATLLKELTVQPPCAGLAALPEHTQLALQNIAAKQGGRPSADGTVIGGPTENTKAIKP